MEIFKSFSRALRPLVRALLKHVPQQKRFFAVSWQSESQLLPIRVTAHQTKAMFATSSTETSSSEESNCIEESLQKLIENLFSFKSTGGRSSLGTKEIHAFMDLYQALHPDQRTNVIVHLAQDYSVDHSRIKETAKATVDCIGADPIRLARNEDILRTTLTPGYTWLFQRIGQLEKGVKFLVDFRADILNCLNQKISLESSAAVHRLNISLRELLSMWFSVGFLNLERVTWQSPCEMLEKISEYEAVHPIRSWTDIKRRVGPYRRCFVFTHSSMPGEPLVVLHTALCDGIVDSMASIVNQRNRNSVTAFSLNCNEDPETIRAAIFYSISSTQRGLQGIDLGNYLIKRVAENLRAEFPYMTQYSTLSPIPAFRSWLLDKIRAAENGKNEVLTAAEVKTFHSHFGEDFWTKLRVAIRENRWHEHENLVVALQAPLMRLCARYLFIEKRRGFALCSVGNFHLSNGAVLWRINWMADMSARGLTNSCGIMVNYRYFLEDTEVNRKEYLASHVIPTTEQVEELSAAAQSLAQPSTSKL